jgi:hypothetical protein
MYLSSCVSAASIFRQMGYVEHVDLIVVYNQP